MPAPDDLAEDGDREMRLARAGPAAEQQALPSVGSNVSKEQSAYAEGTMTRAQRAFVRSSSVFASSAARQSPQ
jgi:hypothetical protein